MDTSLRFTVYVDFLNQMFLILEDCREPYPKGLRCINFCPVLGLLFSTASSHPKYSTAGTSRLRDWQIILILQSQTGVYQ
jgi:hypothetical protein